MSKNIYLEIKIFGFEEYSKYELREIEENDNLYLLQSLDKEEIGFIVLDPFTIYKDYEFIINENDKNILKLKSFEETLVLNIVTVGKDVENTTVNLKAPIIINISTRIGKQIILQDEKYNINESIVGGESIC